MILLDTHVVAWLFAGRIDLLSARARSLIEQPDLMISPIVILELQCLFEIGRTTLPGRTVVEDLQQRIGLEVSTTPFSAVVLAAEQQGWTRDPFDRLIVGHAAAEQATLVTKDATIQSHYPAAAWN